MYKSPIKKLKELRESLEYFAGIVDTHKDIFANLAKQIDNLEEEENLSLSDVPEDEVRFTIIMESGSNCEVSRVGFSKDYWSRLFTEEKLDSLAGHIQHLSNMVTRDVNQKEWK